MPLEHRVLSSQVEKRALKPSSAFAATYLPTYPHLPLQEAQTFTASALKFFSVQNQDSLEYLISAYKVSERVA